MMRLYPVCLKLAGLSCLVVGGGSVARRKIKGLLECGAAVSVVSPEAVREIRELSRTGKITFIRSEYKKIFLKNKFLVIAATDNERVNSRIAADAQKAGVPVNVVDVPELCSFYLPATARQRELLFAVSTQGNFPGLAAKLRREGERLIQSYAPVSGVLFRLRKAVKKCAAGKRDKDNMIKILLSNKTLTKIKQGKIKNFKDFLKHLNRNPEGRKTCT